MNSVRIFSVYLVSNSANGNRYVGVTGKSPERRLREHIRGAAKRLHNGRFYRAIRRYGANCFSVVTLRICKDRDHAMASEIELIAKLKPEYNSTRGGDGQLGRKMTAKARAALLAANKGHKRRLGIPHTPETKEILRQFGLRDKARWLQFSHLGPKSQAKAVVCLDDGLVYESASAAAKHYGADSGVVATVCNRDKVRKTAAGLVFRYFGDHFGGTEDAKASRASAQINKKLAGKKMHKAVLCVTDGRLFGSSMDAQAVYGLSHGFIKEICRGTKSASSGLVFRYVEAPQ